MTIIGIARVQDRCRGIPQSTQRLVDRPGLAHARWPYQANDPILAREAAYLRSYGLPAFVGDECWLPALLFELAAPLLPALEAQSIPQPQRLAQLCGDAGPVLA